MNEKLLKYVGWLPVAAILIYIFGYVSLCSYLQSFGINDNIGLDTNIVKLGILFSVITGPIVLLTFSTFKIGDYSNSVPDVSNDLIYTLHDALGYSLIYSFTLGGLLFKYAFDAPTLVLLALFITAFILNKIKIKTTYSIFLKGLFLFIPFFVIASCVFFIPVTAKYSLYLLELGVFMACCCLRIFNKEGITFQISHIGIIITTLLYATTLFGGSLMVKIPVKYGGEESSPVIYYIDTGAFSKINRTDLKYYIKKNNTIEINTIYETSDKLYFKTSKNKILCVPKSYIDIEELKIP